MTSVMQSEEADLSVCLIAYQRYPSPLTAEGIERSCRIVLVRVRLRQRIQDDIALVAILSLELATGALNTVVTLASFRVQLWTLSGTLPLHVAGLSLAIPGYMVWVAILYDALASVGTHYDGRAPIGINYDRERADADFRFRMIRIREYAESMTLIGGESDEREQWHESENYSA